MSRACLLRRFAALLAVELIAGAATAVAAPRSYPATGNIEIGFTPGDAVDNLIIATIERA